MANGTFQIPQGIQNRRVRLDFMADLSPSTSSTLQPTQGRERIEFLDVLRGFAILGILVVNFEGYGFSGLYGTQVSDRWPSLAQRLAESLITWFGTGKFNIIFTFLFGLGFALQLQRAEDRGQPISARYSRRLIGLLLIGVAHKFFVWAGDILVTYALMGFVLLLFRGIRGKPLLACALLLYVAALLPWEMHELQRVQEETAHSIGQLHTDPSATEHPISPREAGVAQTYARGTFRDIMALRFSEAMLGFRRGYNSFAHVLGLFLLGLYAGKKRIFQRLGDYKREFQSLLVWGGMIGISGAALLHYSYWKGLPGWSGLLRPPLFGASTLALSGAYAAGLQVLSGFSKTRAVFNGLARVGQMALTNYVLQSLICTWIFYSYGLGMYGQIGPLLGLGLTGIIYLSQVALSVWWLRHARYGPLEWVLRSITYNQLQPIWR